MANGCSTATTSSLLLFFLLSGLLTGHALCNQGHHGRTSGYGQQHTHQELPEKHLVLQETVKGLNKDKLPKYTRRIGSTAPICTYNECRGCRLKCTAEQVPVDANDPMNSAYHYKCVCHR
ncbi:EPIDERMAL PATTERNING FACTOR-like protein 9 isoform X2 [Phragmites australis]|uniref:EPIDERMAL PATTERNING FACTOR-like protein 9 isoform X2 n=1 Tax=Phragmites australis TaxID=29695 RepID=UPI002D79EDB5|nr:EPIDERMAL PATTERNING FACTOR-like protein 9 isoform X2 [Phragmites australis]